MLQRAMVNAAPRSRVSAIGPIRRGELESVQFHEGPILINRYVVIQTKSDAQIKPETRS